MRITVQNTLKKCNNLTLHYRLYLILCAILRHTAVVSYKAETIKNSLLLKKIDIMYILFVKNIKKTFTNISRWY